MKILIATEAERSHFLVLAPLGWALRAAGHEVLVASQPELEPVVRAAGLPFNPVGRDHRLRRVIRNSLRMSPGEPADYFGFDMSEDRDEVLTWNHLKEGYGRAVTWWWRLVNDPLVEPMVDLCRGWRPDLVVWEPLTFAAAIAAEASGARHVRFLWGSDLFARIRKRFLTRMAEQPAGEQLDPLASWLATRAARHGVEYSETLTTGHATVEQVPPELRLTGPEDIHYLPMRYVPYNGPAVVPDWIRTPPDRPRIGVCLGTSTTDWYGEREIDLPGLLEGLAELDVEVVATLTDREREQAGTVPSNARLVDYTPVLSLAPTCDLMVSHGGPGTTLTSLAHGIPQLLVPEHLMFDQMLTSRLVEQAGAGRLLASEQVTAENVVRVARTLVEDPRYSRAAQSLSDRMSDMPSPAALSRMLTEVG